MQSSPVDYWATLRLQAEPHQLWVSYEDSRGQRRSPPREPAAVPGWISRPVAIRSLPSLFLTQEQIFVPDSVYLPADFDERLRTLLHETPEIRYGPHATGPVPLPIFVSGPPGTQLLDWEQTVSELLPADVDRDRIQLVRLARERWRARPPYELPMRLLGAGYEAIRGLDRIRGSSWYANDMTVQQFGLQIDALEPEELPGALGSGVYDIVLADETAIQATLRTTRLLRRPQETRPRLIVYLDLEADPLFLASLNVPPGVSFLWAPISPAGDDGPSLVEELVLALIHDYPLHEATKSLVRTVSQGSQRPPILLADPLSNHDLRLSDALEQLRGAAYEFGSRISPGDIDAFLERVSPAAREPLAPHLAAASEHSATIAEAVEVSHSAEFDFGRESFGLGPMAEAESSMAHARNAHSRMAGDLESIAADPELAAEVEAVQERRVEMTMDRLDPNAVYRPFNPAFEALSVRDIFRLNVYVGHRQPNSLLLSEPPPLDPLLPEPEGDYGHTLEVAVFEKGFKVLSPRVQTLYLPRLGGSHPLPIQCQAPDEPGQAELRISIYYQNYLLQSFTMTAQVLGQDAPYSNNVERHVTVQLDFSRTARFANLSELAPRLLSIGSNQNGDGRTHSFLLKKDETAAQPVVMTEALAGQQIGRFRAIVEAAATDIVHFTPDLNGGAPAEEDRQAFEAVIRDLAHLGRDLHRYLYENSPRDMKNQLRRVREVRDEIIQITRHDPGFAFPWPVIYDYPIPRKVSGAWPARVCMGSAFADAPQVERARQNAGCPHNPDEEVYCVEGFWGIRHRLEQLIEQGDALRDAVGVVARPQAQAGVCLAAGVSHRATDALSRELQQRLGNDLGVVRTRDEFYDRLWQPEKRPAVFILLSHMELANKEGEPEGPRMLLSPLPPDNGGAVAPLEAWLQPGDITDRSFQVGEWDEQPRTLVLLMACNGAASDIDTLNDYLTALTSVGAGAIVGTETCVFSDLVSLFAKEVTLTLWQGNTTLGEIIQSFNRRMIDSYNPLAFVFNCFGSADLKVAP